MRLAREHCPCLREYKAGPPRESQGSSSIKNPAVLGATSHFRRVLDELSAHQPAQVAVG